MRWNAKARWMIVGTVLLAAIITLPGAAAEEPPPTDKRPIDPSRPLAGKRGFTGADGQRCADTAFCRLATPNRAPGFGTDNPLGPQMITFRVPHPHEQPSVRLGCRKWI